MTAQSHAHVVQSVARLPFLAGDEGSTPVHALHFTTCDLDAVNVLLSSHHYLGTARTARHVFGAWADDVLVAAQVYRSPTARHVPQHWLELCRWCIGPHAPANAGSQMMGWVRRWIRRNLGPVTLVSYSELGRHDGGLYRASGWQPSPTHHALRFAANGVGYPSGHGTWDGRTVQAPQDAMDHGGGGMTATTRILHKAEDLRYGYDWTGPQPEPWRADALCRGRADWLHHTPPTSAERRRLFAAEVAERMALCAVCPVRRQCAGTAIAGTTQEIASGVWAGVLMPFNSGRKGREIAAAWAELHRLAGVPLPGNRPGRKAGA